VSYLLDTVVISELRKRDRDPGVVDWIASQRSSALFLSVLTVGEIEKGIYRQRHLNPVFADTLTEWLELTMQRYKDRILLVSVPIARHWGRLSGQLGHSGADLLIAATAMEHGLAIVTRNVRHFESTGVEVVNPFSSLLPPDSPVP
jgi:predicted nucleic acid-binding protein